LTCEPLRPLGQGLRAGRGPARLAAQRPRTSAAGVAARWRSWN